MDDRRVSNKMWKEFTHTTMLYQKVFPFFFSPWIVAKDDFVILPWEEREEKRKRLKVWSFL